MQSSSIYKGRLIAEEFNKSIFRPQLSKKSLEIAAKLVLIMKEENKSNVFVGQLIPKACRYKYK